MAKVFKHLLQGGARAGAVPETLPSTRHTSSGAAHPAMLPRSLHSGQEQSKLQSHTKRVRTRAREP